MVSYSALRARLLSDTATGADGASPGMARALERIGWRAVRESTPEELGSHLVALLHACIDDHHDVAVLAHAIAATLRAAGPSLDGGLPPTEAYLPAAEELLREYVSPSPRAEIDWTTA
jgi:hypothetical protein